MRLLRWGSLAASALAGLLVVGLATVAFSPPAATSRPAPTRTPAASETPRVAPASAFDGAAARTHLAYLADPAREGRLTGSRGYLESATYVAERFREIGLEPAGDAGTFFQHFPSPVVELTAMAELAILGPTGTTFRMRADFSELVGGGRGGGTVEAPLVFVGGANDGPSYSDFEGVEVRDAVVLISGPSEGDPAGNALRHGARAVLLVARDDPGPLIHFSYIPQVSSSAVPTLLVTEPVGDRLVASSGRRIGELRRALEDARSRSDRAPLSFDTGLRVRVSVPLGEPREVDGINILGLLRPARAPADDHYVLIGGHLDGVGTDPDGTVYPAANDNASGPAVTIELARTLARMRDQLRRPILFVAWAGEEEGLRGSTAFLERAAGTPLRSRNVLAYINLDVVGCCDALGASQENASLYAAMSSAARKHAITLGTARGSSDHAVFAREGIPATILIWTRTGPIHTPVDDIRPIDAARLGRVGLVATQALLDLAGGE